jgi:hypothetical protein
MLCGSSFGLNVRRHRLFECSFPVMAPSCAHHWQRRGSGRWTSGPKDRADLAWAAGLAGADAWLAWWPPRGKLRWIPASEWPLLTRRVAA